MHVLTNFYNNTNFNDFQIGILESFLKNTLLYPFDFCFAQKIEVYQIDKGTLHHYQFKVIPFASTTTSFIIKTAAIAAVILTISTFAPWWVSLVYAASALALGSLLRLTSRSHSNMNEQYKMSYEIDAYLQDIDQQSDSILNSPHLKKRLFQQEVILKASAKNIEALPAAFFKEMTSDLKIALLLSMRKETNDNSSEEVEEKLKNFILKIDIDQLALEPKLIFELFTYLNTPHFSAIRTELTKQFLSIPTADLPLISCDAYTPMQKTLLVDYFFTHMENNTFDLDQMGAYLIQIFNQDRLSDENAQLFIFCKKAGIDLIELLEKCLVIGIPSWFIDQQFSYFENKQFMTHDRLIKILDIQNKKQTLNEYLSEPDYYFYFIQQQLASKDHHLFIDALLALDPTISSFGLIHLIFKQLLILFFEKGKDLSTSSLALENIAKLIQSKELFLILSDSELIVLLLFLGLDQMNSDPFCVKIKDELETRFTIYLKKQPLSEIEPETHLFQLILEKDSSYLPYQLFMIYFITKNLNFSLNKQASDYKLKLLALFPKINDSYSIPDMPQHQAAWFEKVYTLTNEGNDETKMS